MVEHIGDVGDEYGHDQIVATRIDRFVRRKCAGAGLLIGLAVELDPAVIGLGGRKSVQLRRRVGRHPEEREVAILGQKLAPALAHLLDFEAARELLHLKSLEFGCSTLTHTS